MYRYAEHESTEILCVNEFGKRINANLRAVQFVKDGEAFGVKPVDAEDEFDVLEGDAAGGDDDFLS